jgi:hypothetical protein
MTRKVWTLLALAVLLGGLSLYLNKDWFAKDNIQIYDRSRPVRGGMLGRRRVESSAVNPVVFGFNRKLPLKSVKVVPVNEIETNKFPHPVWYLVSESNSVPTKDFLYGMNIPGMHPAVKEATADPLEPDVKYRLFIESGSIKAEHDFVPVPRLN